MLPDELLGSGGPMQHRGLTHWWGWPAAAAAATYLMLPASVWWLVGAALAGWVSHLAGDLVFGKPDGPRGPGIPIAPWWGHVGLGPRRRRSAGAAGGAARRAPAGAALAGAGGVRAGRPLWHRLGAAVTQARGR